MSSYGRNFSTRLFIQAAFTGLLAPVGSHSSAWLVVTFTIAAGAAAVAAVVRPGHERTRELVITFEAVAVGVGVVGLMGGHYIPGTIVGVAALITAVQHPMPRAVPAVPAQPTAEAVSPVVAPQFAAPAAPQFAAPEYAAPEYAAPQFSAPEAPVAPAPAPAPVAAPPQMAPAPVTGVRAMNILPGK